MTSFLCHIPPIDSAICYLVFAGHNGILIQFVKGNNPYLLCDLAVFRTWKILAAKCALKAKGDVHFERQTD